ncbi:MAG: lipoate--protein ligase [Bacteroidetes bacterium]|nr:lipoate--protein ligase [Bacteroidota bacterium]
MILIDQRDHHDPYLNAAMEDYLVRTLVPGDQMYVMLYINDASVVVGKNQSIYKEVSFEYLRNGGTVVRRLSGGGTVYHDPGNLCFAFICAFDDRRVNNYAYFNQPILDALHAAGIQAEFNKRNDIIWQGKKISGNAQFTDRKNILSHGTLLVNSDIEALRFALRRNEFEIESKGIASVRSTAMNISDSSDQIRTAAELREHLLSSLHISARHDLSEQEWQEVQATAEKYHSAAWLWGRNPSTKIMRDGVTIEVEDGLISSITSAEPHLQNLVGKPYRYDVLKNEVDSATLARIF